MRQLSNIDSRIDDTANSLGARDKCSSDRCQKRRINKHKTRQSGIHSEVRGTHTHTHTYTYTLLHTHTHMIGFVVINKDIRKRVSDTNKHMIQVSIHTGQYLYRLVSIQVNIYTG